MVTGAHPFEYNLISAQRHQLRTGQSRFNLGYAAEKQNDDANNLEKNSCTLTRALASNDGAVR